MKRSKLLVTLMLLLCPFLSCSEENGGSQKTAERITGSYSSDQISNIVVEMMSGRLFFHADDNYFVWRPDEETLSDRLQVIFHFIQHVENAKMIEIGRWPYQKENPRSNRGCYKGENLHHLIDELNLVFE